MIPDRITESKAAMDELEELALLFEKADSLQRRYPGNHELKKIAEDLRQKLTNKREEFKSRNQETGDSENLKCIS